MIHGIIWIHILLSFTKYTLKILNMLNNLWVSRFHFLLLLPFIFVKTPKTKKVLNKRRSVFRLQYFRNSCCFLYIYLPRMNVSICGRKRYSGKPANIWYTTNLLMLGIKMWRRDLYGKQRKNTLWSKVLFPNKYFNKSIFCKYFRHLKCHYIDSNQVYISISNLS